jgi:hypothetical protein
VALPNATITVRLESDGRRVVVGLPTAELLLTRVA